MQFLIQASQVGGVVVDLRNPLAQVSQPVLLAGHYLQLAIVHFPNPTSKKYPSAGFVHFATSTSVQEAQLAAHLVGTLALRKYPTEADPQVFSVAEVAVHEAQPSPQATGAPENRVYPAAADLQVVLSEQSAHPVIVQV